MEKRNQWSLNSESLLLRGGETPFEVLKSSIRKDSITSHRGEDHVFVFKMKTPSCFERINPDPIWSAGRYLTQVFRWAETINQGQSEK